MTRPPCHADRRAPRAAPRGCQRGQALTEFLVVALALVPLFLLMPVIAKYQDIAHATQMASRYVAFDATQRNDALGTWKPESQVADEVRRRFFSNSDAPIKTNDTAGDFAAHRIPFWSDPQGSPLIRTFSDVKVSFGPGEGATRASAFSAAGDGAPFQQHGRLDLQARGLYTGNVAVTLAKLPAGIRSIEPFDRIDLSMKRHTTVTVDTWTARSPQHTEDRFQGFAPIQQVLASPLGSAIGAGITLMELGEVDPPEFGNLDEWRDLVPADRLGRNP